MVWDKIERRKDSDWEKGKQIIDFIHATTQEQSRDIKELIRLAAQVDNRTIILLNSSDAHKKDDNERFEKVDTRLKFLERGYFIFVGIILAIEGFFKIDKWTKP